MANVRAKVRCTSRNETPGMGTSLSFSAVTDGSEENKSFSDATPNLSLNMTISPGKAAADAFRQGQEYYVDFSPAQ